MCSNGRPVGTVDGLVYVCPLCREELSPVADGFKCGICGRNYPSVVGIPDLRVGSDRYLTLDEDRAKAIRLADLADRSGLSFAELVRAYWNMTPEVPAALAERYARNTIDGVRRADEWLRVAGPPRAGESILDVGCGTGGLVVAAARLGAVVVGADTALRWLVLGRRLLEEQGIDATLVAADGSLPPFRVGSFDRVLSVETLEHATDQRGLLQQCLLLCRPGGRVLVVTANRFSVAAETNVRLWGIGFLPRRWTARYVHVRRQTRYQFLRPLSAWELRAMVGLRDDMRVGPGPLPAPPVDASRSRLAAQEAYETIRQSSVAAQLLTPVAPYLQVAGEVSL
jgi:2-polyprenyl-3-methyl-5-hydroxy-6-metoxy-1,4-benzoquinol methylase